MTCLHKQVIFIFLQMDECFCRLASEFYSTEALHQVMPFVNGFHILASMAIASFPFLIGHRRDVYIIGRLEKFTLHTAHHLVIIEFEIISQSYPGIIHQLRTHPMIRMRINRPVREDHIRLLGRY